MMQNNTPGIISVLPLTPVPTVPISTQGNTHAMPSMARQKLVTNHAINALTMSEEKSLSTVFTPLTLLSDGPVHKHLNFKHFACPMVHPVTGKTISSYK
jgi:hypothetical protein